MTAEANVEIVPVAQIPLARSVPRLLAIPALTGLAALAIVVAALVTGGAAGTLVAVVAGAMLLLAVIGGAVLLSIRLEVELSAIRLRWLGGERHYALVRGPVTRVALRGQGAAKLRAAIGLFDWSVGRAVLRDEEPIEVVRLAPTRSVIVVPTDHGRLAIAPRSEGELVNALAAAARVQQRLDEMTGRAAPEPLRVARPAEETYASLPVATDAVDEPAEPEMVQPRLLTGIERAMLEERLARERAAAEAAAEAARAAAEERAAAERLAAIAAEVARAPVPGVIRPAEPPAAAPVRRPRRVRRRGRWSRPGWYRPAEVPWAAIAAAIVPPVLPVAVTGAMLGALALGGRIDTATVEGRFLLLGLILAGPSATLGVLLAKVWWPRLVGLVLAGSLSSAVLLGRVIVG